MKLSAIGRRRLFVFVIGVAVAFASGCVMSWRGAATPYASISSAQAFPEEDSKGAGAELAKLEAPLKYANAADDADLIPPTDWPLGKQARFVARGLAKRHQDVERVGVCYKKADDEWWITLYEPAGNYFELRKYIWSALHDKPEPYLVQERIAKNRLDRELATASRHKSCQILTAVNGNWDSRGESKVASKRSPAPKPAPRLAALATVGPAKPSVSRVASDPLQSSRAQKRKVAGLTEASSRPRSEDARKRPWWKSNKAARNEALVKTVYKEPLQGVVIRSDDRYEKAAAPTRRASYVPAKKESYPRAPEREAITAERNRSAAVENSATGGNPQAVQSGPAQTEASAVPTKSMPTCYVFVYGSQMNHPVLQRWLKHNGYDPSMMVDASPAILEGYDYVWNRYSEALGSGTVNLKPKSHSSVWGLLMEVDDGLLKALDRREGHPIHYSRGDRRMPIRRVKDGKTVFAWLYLAQPDSSGRSDIWPSRDYKKLIVDGARFWQFPRSYVATLEAWPTQR